MACVLFQHWICSFEWCTASRSASSAWCSLIGNPLLFHGAAEKRVIPGSADGQYEFGSFMSATLSCDHRVIDGNLICLRCIHALCLWLGKLTFCCWWELCAGAIGAEFLKAFKGYIENPTSMLLWSLGWWPTRQFLWSCGITRPPGKWCLHFV